MEVRNVPDLEPASDDESALAGMLFERLTEMLPDLAMTERSDLAMAMVAVVKKWAHNLDLTSESHKIVEAEGYAGGRVVEEDEDYVVYEVNGNRYRVSKKPLEF